MEQFNDLEYPERRQELNNASERELLAPFPGKLKLISREGDCVGNFRALVVLIGMNSPS